MGKLINPSLWAQVTPRQVRRSYQRSGSVSSDTNYEAHQNPQHTIVNINRHYQRPQIENNHSAKTRDQKLLARESLIHSDQMSKAHDKSSNKNNGSLYDDDGVNLLSRLAEKRPEVIGGKIHELNVIQHS